MTARAFGIDLNIMLFVLMASFLATIILIYLIFFRFGTNFKAKKALRNLINNLIRNGSKYTVVYATDQEYSFRTIVVKSFAIAFREDELYIIPVSFVNGKVYGDRPTLITKDDIEKVDYDNMTEETTIKLIDTNEIIKYRVMPATLKLGNTAIDQVNIDQTDEYRKHIEFIKNIAK